MKPEQNVYNLWLEFESKDEKLKDLPFVENAQTDNDRLLNLQYEFLKNDSQNAYAQLWQGFTVLCLKALKKELKAKNLFLDADELIYRADIACEYVMRRYKSYLAKKGEYYVIQNFIATAHDAMIHALYGEGETDRFLEKCESLDELKNV